MLIKIACAIVLTIQFIYIIRRPKQIEDKRGRGRLSE